MCAKVTVDKERIYRYSYIRQSIMPTVLTAIT